MLPGIAGGLPYDLLVAQVDAVKKANRQAYLPFGLAEFTEMADEFHRLVGVSRR